MNHYLKNDYVDLIYQLSCEQKCACLYHCLDRTYLTISRKELELYFIQYVMKKDRLTTFEAKEKYKRYYIYNYGRCDKYIDDIKKKKVVKAEFVFLNNYQYDQIFDGAEQSPGQSIEPPQCHMMRNVMYQPHQLNAYNVNDKEQ